MPVLRRLHMSPFAIIALVLILARAIAELLLSRANERYVRAHANEVPPAFREMVDEPTYRRSVDYTLAKSRFGDVVTLFDAVLLTSLLFSGFLPWAFGKFTVAFGTSVWALAGFLFATGVVLSIVSLPFAWYAQFKLEDRFGFNTTTARTWVLDRVKGFLLAAMLGFPSLALVLKLIEWTGPNWWIWAAGVVITFQLLLLLIAPAVIMPLFNKFTPITEGELAQRIQRLLERCGFKSSGLYLMDGSKRSSHGNAFFTGFGAAKRIVLFDTLVSRLEAPEVEAVLAHELGHYRLHHIAKSMALSAAVSFVVLWVLGQLIDQAWFYQGLGVRTPSDAAALALFLMVLPEFLFFVQPLTSRYSRKREFEADAYATSHASAAELVRALVKLYQDNAATLTPDPLHSAFYDSHRPAAMRIARLEPK